MFFNQTLNGRIELGSYSVGKIRFFGVALDFAIVPVIFSPSPGNLFESMRGHPSVPGYQGEFPALQYVPIHVILENFLCGSGKFSTKVEKFPFLQFGM